MSSSSKHFEKVVSSLSIVGGFVLPLRKPSPVVERFLRFEGTLEDWRTACRRFDVHFDEWRSYPERLKEHFKPGLNNALGAEQKEFLTQWGALTADIRFDIHCFYIFSKIPFVAFGAVLFERAENWFEGWQSDT